MRRETAGLTEGRGRWIGSVAGAAAALGLGVGLWLGASEAEAQAGPGRMDGGIVTSTDQRRMMIQELRQVNERLARMEAKLDQQLAQNPG